MDWLHDHMLSFQSPVCCHIFFVREPAAYSARVLNFTPPVADPSFSILFMVLATSFLKTRVALFRELNTTVVLRSSTWLFAMCSLMFGCIGASTVARNLVAIVTPQA